MNNLLAARSQMAMSLAFHIIFAVIGIALPLMMVIAEAAWLRTGDPVYRVLARRWAKGAAILFAVGAVSGTVLSFELGLLWPGFMKSAGPIIGMPFSLEGFAFFTEAIFLGIYLYGWDKVPPMAHWLSGVMVAVSGAASGVLVVLGQRLDEHAGRLRDWSTARSSTNIDPIRRDGEPGGLGRDAAHDPGGLRRDRVRWRPASMRTGCSAIGPTLSTGKRLAIALAVGGVASILQPISGDYAAEGRCEDPAGEARGDGRAVQDRAPGPAPDRRACPTSRPARPATPSRFPPA